MSESTLAITYTELKQAVAHYLGLGLDSTSWSLKETQMLDLIIKRGLRQFYRPPKIHENEDPHRWSFLHPIRTLTTIGPYSDGTVSVSNGSNEVLLDSGIWPAWAAANGTLVIGTTYCEIASRENDTLLKLVKAWDQDDKIGQSYVLFHNGIYDLPDEYGGIEGNLTYPPRANKPDVVVVNEAQIRSMQAGTCRQTGYPRAAAVRIKQAATEKTAGQRYEICFWPVPDASYVLSYQMAVAMPDMITDNNPYPLGGAAHGETILASCLAAAESLENDQRGVKWEDFLSRLTASIEADYCVQRAQNLGYNADRSDSVHADGRYRRSTNPNLIITYNGER